MAGTVWTSAAATNNPIQWIKPDSNHDAAPQYIKCPSAYSFEIDDISNPDAGRTATGRMIKSQLYRGSNPVRAYSATLEWSYLSDADIAGILSILQQEEYLYVKFFNPGSNTYYAATMYVGNRTMPMYNKAMGIWTTLSVKLISRN